jgi:hypothetical protein
MAVVIFLLLALVCFLCAAGGLSSFGGIVQTLPLGLAFCAAAWLVPLLFR